ncbi:hypothetical protein EDF38_1318 [Frigoribacterium sp. PhB160]|uniref:hypothetical protein n=1 Tax=Frigoribacterium sp. PhB160 TaxID=2485192 RepID=UPI000FB65443|nr:hypothetical protein [Frigoribacterium sp. PhB160]ROS62215.1 hypothetical protein EDF38_1318 [Frigoribacterium sp. PhB160]
MVDTTLLVALGGGAGISLMLREIISVLATVRSGVSAREGKRRTDIVQQRDEAILRADAEAAKRRNIQEYAARLRVQLIENGLEPGDPPVIERTTPTQEEA